MPSGRLALSNTWSHHFATLLRPPPDITSPPTARPSIVTVKIVGHISDVENLWVWAVGVSAQISVLCFHLVHWDAKSDRYKIYLGPPSAKLDGSQGANFCNPPNKGFCTPPIGGCWYKKKDCYFMLFHSFSMWFACWKPSSPSASHTPHVQFIMNP